MIGPDTAKKRFWGEFEADANALDGAQVLVAAYSYESYSGDAYVLFRRDGKLFEVRGGHCSCHGLEGQWEPEETTPETILHWLGKGIFDQEPGFTDAVRAALQQGGSGK